MKIDRNKTLQQLLDELGYEKYIDEEVLATLKNEGAEEVELEFFTLGRKATIDEVRAEYAQRNLIPDMGATITYFMTIPQEDRDIGLQLEGQAFATFDRWYVKRRVYVNSSDSYWNGVWWFCGTKKEPFNKPKKIVIEGERGMTLGELLSKN